MVYYFLYIQYIFKLCGSTLKTLDLSSVEVKLFKYKKNLRCVEILDLGSCSINDDHLMLIPKLCGSTLKYIDISHACITGENLSIAPGTLNSLEHLILKGCQQLTNKGLLNILQLCGKKLKILNLGYTIDIWRESVSLQWMFFFGREHRLIVLFTAHRERTSTDAASSFSEIFKPIFLLPDY